MNRLNRSDAQEWATWLLLHYKKLGGYIDMKSDAVKKGSAQAPHRSLFNALGFTKEEMIIPLIAVC